MKPFLKKVADVYALNEADRLYKYCFVLPNRRSRVFFESYLSDALNDKHSIFPELTTLILRNRINEWVLSVSSVGFVMYKVLG